MQRDLRGRSHEGPIRARRGRRPRRAAPEQFGVHRRRRMLGLVATEALVSAATVSAWHQQRRRRPALLGGATQVGNPPASVGIFSGPHHPWSRRPASPGAGRYAPPSASPTTVARQRRTRPASGPGCAESDSRLVTPVRSLRFSYFYARVLLTRCVELGSEVVLDGRLPGAHMQSRTDQYFSHA